MSATPKVGQWADHKNRQLDPREVAEVSENGKKIRLQIGTIVTDWVPAKNYDYLEARS